MTSAKAASTDAPAGVVSLDAERVRRHMEGFDRFAEAMEGTLAWFITMQQQVEQLQQQFGLQAITVLEGHEETRINYPVLEYPVKVKSFNLDKTPDVGGTLLGIKGQYLLFDTGVINIRKYGGYHLTLSLE